MSLAEAANAGVFDKRHPSSLRESMIMQPTTSSVCQLFLSCVTKEFSRHREMLAKDLNLPHVKVQVQEDFIEGGHSTLAKLNDYIRNCAAIIHLVGVRTGNRPKEHEIPTLLKDLPKFVQKFPFLKDHLASLSYTQWEAWLAIYHDVPCFIYRAELIATPASELVDTEQEQLLQEQKLQEQHWQRFREYGKDRKTFRDEQELCRLVLRSLATILPSGDQEVTVIPMGLRSFEERHSGFFLGLLPGQHDEKNLPESILFWKHKIEKSYERSFKVGVIYGPSGCGKSSLIKAGLLPRLAAYVTCVYIEATANGTETRLLSGIRKQIPALTNDLDLPRSVAELSQGNGLNTGSKLLLVVDQFEQWLHARPIDQNTELVRVLRQCDGEHVQCLLIVRDDFWTALSRFVGALGVKLLQDQKSVFVDLFDLLHAKRLLAAFGRGYGRLEEDVTPEQKAFIDKAVDELSQDGRVISVRLALFAAMVRGKLWVPKTLKEIGGIEGVGFTFLEETFAASAADPNHRRHQNTARLVLKALLPETGTDIKGHMLSYQELLEASDSANRPQEFDDLLRILDTELRLITPTEPEVGSVSSSPRDSSLATRYYQLTHDYLVPSLREWLTRKQKETRRGRAELKLEERSSLWNAKQEAKFLPSLPEWFSIRMLTSSKHWSKPQRTMMDAAARLDGIRSLVVTAVLCMIVAAGFGFTRQADERRNQVEATRLVEGLLSADTVQVSGTIDSLHSFGKWADPQLKKAFAESPDDSIAKLHAALAMVVPGQAVDRELLDFLRERLLTVTAAQFGPVRKLLEPHKAELIPAYWELTLDEKQPAKRRFHAACALAAFDPDSANAKPAHQSSPQQDAVNTGWHNPSFILFVAEHLVTVSPEYIGQYKELFRPVASQLVPALSDIFKDPARGEVAKSLATSCLADYASQDPATLAELILAADPANDKELFPILQQHQQIAIKHLEAVLEQRLEPDWQDSPLDPAWTTPSPAVHAQIESAHGLISERFAYCQDMTFEKFLEVAEALRPSGYRPTKIRPIQSLLPLTGGEGARRADEGVGGAAESVPYESAPIIAALWTRDSKLWHLDPGLKQSDLPAPDAPASKDDLLLIDIAPLPSTNEVAEPQFIALWCEAPSSNADANAPGADAGGSELEQRRVVIDVTESELTAAQTILSQHGFASQCTITVRTDSGRQRYYTGIWSNQGAVSELRQAYPGFELVYQLQWDVAVALAGKLADPLEQYRQQLAQIEALPAERLEDPAIREIRAAAHYQLGDLEPALADLEFLISKEIVTASVLQFRTLTLVRLGKTDEAKESLEKYLSTAARAAVKSYVQIQVSAWLGEFEQATAQLESAALEASKDPNDLYNIACAAALSSQAFSAKDPAQSQEFADRAIELLKQIVTQGYSDVAQLKSDPDIASLHADSRFLAVLTQLEPPATFAAVWRADVQFESKLFTSVPLDGLLDQFKPLIAAGWRPFSIAINPTPPSLFPSPPGKGEKVADRPDEGASAASLLCTLLLHRPIIPDEKKETLALRQAAAATALLRLNSPEKIWPLFQDQPDPRLRSYVLHRLATYDVDPQSLLTQLQQESEVSRRRTLILGIGEFARAKLLSEEQQAAVTADLAKRYADEPDSGIHGATEWTLRQLGANAAIAEVRAAFSTGEVVGDRRWYLTKTGDKSATSSGMTFAIIQPEEEFLMGSPVTEEERYGGPSNKDEARHFRRLGRTFAIGTHEVTVAEFKVFRDDHRFHRIYAREEDTPANVIDWYDAAAYCNWLSKQENIPPKQWCYDPKQAFAEGMTLYPDYLQRTGYRLPSEAEWEYACRAGTMTARYFGQTETLLGEYAWYTKTSGDKWMLPVGTLRPNGAGLFDMQGNVLEWCQEEYGNYDTHAPRMGDQEQTGKLDDNGFRVLRGGSFSSRASYVHSATRLANRAVNSDGYIGFRVGRTLPPVSLTALPPAEGGSKFEN